ncbi:MAG: polyprenyl synthetase family protein [Candidatus Marinimicrobia bacterium]|nr:polyprenyl synthetase family protein [Candidatus Neomarinimicrobiota bacterium]MDD5062568.1 polyprenyl synthetase family protein [Candidatus Neomarinimicrobiota bacterium]
MNVAFSDKILRLREEIDRQLNKIDLPEISTSLAQPMRFSLNARAKRLRPILVLLVGEDLGGSRQNLMPAALAVEVLHTFTLVHDDIMDNDSVRRGQQTVHVKWNVNTAILTGDGLNALAFRLLMQTKSVQLDRIGTEFSQAMLEICDGQAFDLAFEKIDGIDTEDYMNMIARKTGRLLGLACQLGALVADASPKIVNNLNLFGQELGLAFQIQDDLLELTADQEAMGKSLGSDLAAGKKTFPVITALNNMTEKQRLAFLSFLKANAVNRRLIVRELTKLGAIQQTAAVIEKLLTNARQRITSLPEQLQNDLNDMMGLIARRQS